MEHQGRVDAVSGNVEELTGNVLIRASFDNSEGLFRNSSNGIVRLPYHITDVIVIPQEATFDIQNKIFVFKVVDGVAKATDVEVMPYSDGQNYVVTDGLKPGDVIIAEGAGLLKDGTRVKLRSEK